MTQWHALGMLDKTISLKLMDGNRKKCQRLAKSEKKHKRMINQAKLKAYRHDPFWKFGVLVPQNHAQAAELHKANGNKKWQDAEVTERSQLSQLFKYHTFVAKRKVLYMTLNMMVVKRHVLLLWTSHRS
jgi:hypothetical protein